MFSIVYSQQCPQSLLGKCCNKRPEKRGISTTMIIHSARNSCCYRHDRMMAQLGWWPIQGSIIFLSEFQLLPPWPFFGGDFFMILSKFLVPTSYQSLINISITASFMLQELQTLYLHSLCVAPKCWTISNNKSSDTRRCRKSIDQYRRYAIFPARWIPRTSRKPRKTRKLLFSRKQ